MIQIVWHFFFIYCFSSFFADSQLTAKITRTKQWDNEDFCGTREKLGREAIPLIVGGHPFQRGTWPFIVAIFEVSDYGPTKYICGGTLVTKLHVITAAHCILEKYSTQAKPLRFIKLRLGVHDLNDVFESGSVNGIAKDIKIHEEWNPLNERFDADIAIITMGEEVQYSRYIKPACLFDSTDQVLGINHGIVVGFGQSEDKSKYYQNIARQLTIPITNSVQCLTDEPRLAKIASTRTFCAGSRQGSNPCRGDSGSGLFVLYNGRYYLAGIVSASLVDDRGFCDVNNYALFTNMHAMSRWINMNIIHERRHILRASDLIQSRSSFDTTEAEEYNCGVMSVPTTLIQSGTWTSDGQWPWVVGVVKKKNYYQNDQIDKYCSGSLISNRHVFVEPLMLSQLTDDDTRPFPPASQLKVYAGTNDLDAVDSFQSESRDVSFIIAHRDSKFSVTKSAKIAILVMREPINFSANIRPICIWDRTANASLFDRQRAATVGFGQDLREEKNADRSKHKKYLQMQIYSQQNCPPIHQLFISGIHNNVHFFCARGVNNGTPCLGDVYSLYFRQRDVWYLFGLAAWFSATKNEETSTCDDGSIIAYENIAFYANWIRSIVKTY